MDVYSSKLDSSCGAYCIHPHDPTQSTFCSPCALCLHWLDCTSTEEICHSLLTIPLHYIMDSRQPGGAHAVRGGSRQSAVVPNVWGVYRMKSCFGVEWLMLNDPKAIAHVLQGQTTSYHLEESLRQFLSLVTGKGIIYADGPDHARQRKLLQPAFSPSFVKTLTPQVVQCANRVAKQWECLINQSEDASAVVNAYQWAERLTMETIGQTAFGVRFGAIEGEAHELAQSYMGFLSAAYSQPSKLSIALQALALHIPPWIIALARHAPLKRLRVLNTAKATSLAFARKLIQETRAQPEGLVDRHILSILARASNPSAGGKLKRMTEEEIYEQLTTFFVAGYETSCNTLSFAFYELARAPSVQEKVYAEVSDVLGSASALESFEYSVFDDMPYLQAVVKEVFRLHSVVTHGTFQAGTDNVIPFSKPVTTITGERIHTLTVRKGQRVLLSFDGVNTSRDVWGLDAAEFRPERWLEGRLDEVSPDNKCAGPYANLANFGGGPKTCIAWRLAVIELQTFVAVLVNRFRLEIGVPDYKLWKAGCNIVVNPTAKGQESRGPWMPLKLESRAVL
ncbi:cytochrome P450 [Gautieria morchelliformis]|nr:cytochrome P450 [Gautieria morchelliformis]